jgi:hypothetical protein
MSSEVEIEIDSNEQITFDEKHHIPNDAIHFNLSICRCQALFISKAKSQTSMTINLLLVIRVKISKLGLVASCSTVRHFFPPDSLRCVVQ